MEPILITSSVLFGKEVISQTITNTAKNLLYSVNDLLQNEHFIFKKILDDYDLNFKIEIITNYIEGLSIEELDKPAIKSCIKYLEEILVKIKKEVDNIKNEISVYNLLWFNRFRTPTYKILILNLKNDITILSNRFDILTKIKN
jgi:hypothetical protein